MSGVWHGWGWLRACRERQEQDKAYFEEQQAAQAAAHRKAWEVDVQEKKR